VQHDIDKHEEKEADLGKQPIKLDPVDVKDA
jgi:hypothetical protein